MSSGERTFGVRFLDFSGTVEVSVVLLISQCSGLPVPSLHSYSPSHVHLPFYGRDRSGSSFLYPWSKGRKRGSYGIGTQRIDSNRTERSSFRLSLLDLGLIGGQSLSRGERNIS